MRVGYLTYGLDRQPNGIGRYSLELLSALAALPDGPEMVLLTTEREDRHDLWTRFERHGLSGCRRLPALLSVGNLALSRAARRWGLDVIHDPNGIAPFLGPKPPARRLVTIHDAFAFVHPETHNRLDNWRYRWLLGRAARRADLVLTDSEHSQADLVRYLGLAPSVVRVIGLGIGPQFRPVEPGPDRQAVLSRYGLSERPYLLYVGGLNARKNLARLLEAFDRLAGDYPRLQLVVNGQRQWRLAELDRAYGQMQHPAQVHLTGYVADQDLPALYSGATAFVFPSLYEGFGLPPLEAMACGTPVVCSQAASLPEVVGQAALLVDPYQSSSLELALRRILSEPGLAGQLTQRGLEQAKKWNWQATAHQTLAAYREVLARPQPLLAQVS